MPGAPSACAHCSAAPYCLCTPSHSQGRDPPQPRKLTEASSTRQNQLQGSHAPHISSFQYSFWQGGGSGIHYPSESELLRAIFRPCFGRGILFWGLIPQAAMRQTGTQLSACPLQHPQKYYGFWTGRHLKPCQGNTTWDFRLSCSL